MHKCLSTLLNLCLFLPALAQEPAAPYLHKLSPQFLSRQDRLQKTAQGQSVFWIVSANSDSLQQMLNRQPRLFRFIKAYPKTGLLVVESEWTAVEQWLLPLPYVQFIDAPRQPREELFLKRFDQQVNAITLAHRNFPEVTGKNSGLSIKENRYDTLDIDWKGRHLPTPLASATGTTHASIMATLAAGGGNSYYTGKGVAPAATLSSASFASLLPESDADYLRYGITVQNHSYGTGIENYYGADAAAYDASVWSNPALLQVFSAGNSGNQTSPQGLYRGIPNRANLTGSFKMAKNILTVGAVDSFYRLETLSSRGPAYDGRIKPELVAFGEDGSSGAAAITSGAALLIQQLYRDQHNGNLPPSSLTRALFINTAEDLEAPGPDFNTGYGNLNVARALQATQLQRYASGTVSAGHTTDVPLEIPPGCHQARITLCWNDPAAAANSTKSLVNDLDLVVQQQNNGFEWQPWVLNAHPHPDSLNASAIRGKDSLNNTEQVTLNHPEAGSYRIKVKPNALSTASQSFALCWDFTMENDWEWVAPVKGSALIPAEPVVLRWHTANHSSTAILEYQFIGSAGWQTADTILLHQGWHRWVAPDTTGRVQLRVRIGAASYATDTLLLIKIPVIKVGLDCEDSLLLYWNRIPGANQYRLYTLGERYLTPFTTFADTFAIVSKQAFTNPYFSVAPIAATGTEGPRSVTINYKLQGMNCYWRNFLVDLTPDPAALLRFQLGSFYRVAYLEVEKWKEQQFRPITRINQLTLDEIRYLDEALTPGANTYRIKIVRTDGSAVYTSAETVYYVGTDDYLIYPNPVARGALGLTLISREYEGGELSLLDLNGRLILQQPLYSSISNIPTGRLPAGMYVLKIVRQDKPAFIRKVVIR